MTRIDEEVPNWPPHGGASGPQLPVGGAPHFGGLGGSFPAASTPGSPAPFGSEAMWGRPDMLRAGSPGASGRSSYTCGGGGGGGGWAGAFSPPGSAPGSKRSSLDLPPGATGAGFAGGTGGDYTAAWLYGEPPVSVACFGAGGRGIRGCVSC